MWEGLQRTAILQLNPLSNPSNIPYTVVVMIPYFTLCCAHDCPS